MGYIYDTNEIINFFLYNTEVYTHENYVDICKKNVYAITFK